MKFILILLLTWTSSFAVAQENDDDGICEWTNSEISHLQSLLSEQSQILRALEDNVVSVNYSRVLMLEKAATDVYQNIFDNVLAGRISTTIQTRNLIQQLSLKYRFSSTFLGWDPDRLEASIYSDINAPLLQKLQKSSKELETLFTRDNAELTITSTTLSEMRELLDQLSSLAIRDDLKAKLKDLIPAVKSAQDVAGETDGPCAFFAGTRIYGKIQALYPDFEKIVASDDGYKLIMELQGLNEFYSEFAQTTKQTVVGECRKKGKL